MASAAAIGTAWNQNEPVTKIRAAASRSGVVPSDRGRAGSRWRSPCSTRDRSGRDAERLPAAAEIEPEAARAHRRGSAPRRCRSQSARRRAGERGVDELLVVAGVVPERRRR